MKKLIECPCDAVFMAILAAVLTLEVAAILLHAAGVL